MPRCGSKQVRRPVSPFHDRRSSWQPPPAHLVLLGPPCHHALGTSLIAVDPADASLSPIVLPVMSSDPSVSVIPGEAMTVHPVPPYPTVRLANEICDEPPLDGGDCARGLSHGDRDTHRHRS